MFNDSVGFENGVVSDEEPNGSRFGHETVNVIGADLPDLVLGLESLAQAVASIEDPDLATELAKFTDATKEAVLADLERGVDTDLTDPDKQEGLRLLLTSPHIGGDPDAVELFVAQLVDEVSPDQALAA